MSLGLVAEQVGGKQKRLVLIGIHLEYVRYIDYQIVKQLSSMNNVLKSRAFETKV